MGGAVTEIRVAQGLYTPDYGTGDRKMSFPLVSGVALLGGYAGINEPDPNVRDPDVYVSTFSGDLNGDDLPDFVNNEENSYAVIFAVDVDQTAVLDGFFITAGNADSRQFGYSGGAGMMNDEGSPVIRNCVFTGGSGFGGGVTNCFHGSPTFNGCLFANNRGPFGGGLANFLVDNAAIINCRFTANTAFPFDGGGVGNIESSSAFINCIFTGNTAASGGGMRNLRNSVPLVINCTFSDNSASASPGGAISSRDTSFAIVANSVLWANSPGEIEGTAAVSYSNVQGGFTGTGNIDSDPLFVDPANGDYHLSPGSPSIDAGDNTTVPLGVTTDLDGNPRYIDIFAVADTGNGTLPIVDMGAYEHVTDCNGNGIGDEQDIAGGTSLDCNGNGIPDECEPDCNDNGVADSCDIAEGTSPDENGNGIPDECDCPTPSPPEPVTILDSPAPGFPKVLSTNRFLLFTAGDAGQHQAIRITLKDLPDPYHIWNGFQMWVGEAKQVTENPGFVDPDNPLVPPGTPTFWAAMLQCTPHCSTEWSTMDPINVFGEAIVPSTLQTSTGPILHLAKYDVQVIGCNPGCNTDPDDENNYSAALEAHTSGYGDTMKDCAFLPDPCTPPDDRVDQTDISQVIKRFSGDPLSIVKARADIDGLDPVNRACVNLKIDQTDVFEAVQGFQGLNWFDSYGPSDQNDPCNSNCTNPMNVIP